MDGNGSVFQEDYNPFPVDPDRGPKGNKVSTLFLKKRGEKALIPVSIRLFIFKCMR